MASAQVLSNSSRKEHLEAGKRRLEEFRKKKAADRAKKAASSTQSRTAESTTFEKQALDGGEERLLHSGDVVTSGRDGNSASGPSDLATDTAERSDGFSHVNELKTTSHVNADSPFMNNDSAFISDMTATQLKVEEQKSNGFPGNQANSYLYQQAEIGDTGGVIGERRYAGGALSHKPKGDYLPVSQDHNSRYRVDGARLSEANSFPEFAGPAYSHADDLVVNVDHERFGSLSVQGTSDSTEFEKSTHRKVHLNNHLVPPVEERKLSYSSDPLSSSLGDRFQAPDKLSAAFHFDARDSSNYAPSQLATTESHPRRSRPSFLDSLNIPRAPSTSSFTQYEPPKQNSAEAPTEIAEPPPYQKPFQEAVTVGPSFSLATSDVPGTFSGNSFWGQSMYENNTETKMEFQSQKQNEDFAALEQHIEDLTQERFSLQRALDASKVLSESLAAENSSLTESYNNQASVVSQLKYEMENLQVEIKAQLGELEAMKLEYTNAQLECNAADERAKLLASEVISLEEKALRLRSNELKLEKELERSNNELTSCKKKLSSVEKDRRDLQQTIDALQEEKKLLQSKLRKASARGTSEDINKAHPKKDVSTSTDDLGLEVVPLAQGENGGSMPSTSYGTGHGSTVLYSSDAYTSTELTPFSFEVPSTTIPPDQIQLIENINSLVSELTAEKEELTQALVAEVTASSKLKDLNKELSKKLEVQTRKLELLTSQSLAGKNVPARQPTDSRTMQEDVPYADEGDEVVERVLGWIMKLFPGGPSKRRTSKLL